MGDEVQGGGVIPPRPPKWWPPGRVIAWAWGGLWVRGHVVNQFALFCLVGTSGLGVNTLVMWGCYEGLKLGPMISAVVAFVVANFSNFILNKYLTFQDPARGVGRVGWQYIKFLGVTLVGLGINLAILKLLLLATAMYPVAANVLGVLGATVVNFLGTKFVAFGPQRGV